MSKKDIEKIMGMKERMSYLRQMFGLAADPPGRDLLQRIRSAKNQNQQGQRQGILPRLFPQAQQAQEPVAVQQPRQSATEHPIQSGQGGVTQPSVDYGQGHDEQDAKVRRSRKMSVKDTEED